MSFLVNFIFYSCFIVIHMEEIATHTVTVRTTTSVYLKHIEQATSVEYEFKASLEKGLPVIRPCNRAIREQVVLSVDKSFIKG